MLLLLLVCVEGRTTLTICTKCLDLHRMREGMMAKGKGSRECSGSQAGSGCWGGCLGRFSFNISTYFYIFFIHKTGSPRGGGEGSVDMPNY